jgi:hypothetical protein
MQVTILTEIENQQTTKSELDLNFWLTIIFLKVKVETRRNCFILQFNEISKRNEKNLRSDRKKRRKTRISNVAQ